MVKKRRSATTRLLFGIKWPKDRHAFWMGIGIGALGAALAAFYYEGHRLFDSLGIHGIPMAIGDDPGDLYRQERDAGQIPSLRTHPAFGYLGAAFIYIGAVLSFAMYPFRREDDAFTRLLSSIRLERISGSILARHIPVWLGIVVMTYVLLTFFYSALVAVCVSALVATFVRFMSHQFGSGQVTWSSWLVIASLCLWAGAESIESVEHEVVRIILNQVSGLMRFVFAASFISLSVGLIRWLHRARHSFEESERFWESPDGRLLARARLKLAALRQRGDSTSMAYAWQLEEAIEHSDYLSIGEILRAEDAYATAAVNRGLREYHPSGGRPTVIELSVHLERRCSEAPDPYERGTRAAGFRGESLAVRRLEGLLDESWTIIGGYENGGGETDILVVGPYGICVIEVENYQGLVSVDESSWSSQRYDWYGGPTGSLAPMEDATGRSPSDQVNGASDALERFLSRRFDFPISVRRVVVLTHSRCELGSIREPEVDTVLKIDHVTPASIFSGRSYNLGAGQVDRLTELIQQDHVFNTERDSEQVASADHSLTAAGKLFINRKMMAGLGVAAFSLIIAAIIFWFATNVIDVPQENHLVALIPSPGSITLKDVGESVALNVQGHFSNSSPRDLDSDLITYESSNPEIATVSPDGIVTANGPGAADILIEYGGRVRNLHTLVFEDTPGIPPADPADIGPIPNLEVEVRAVLNRVIIELQPDYDYDTANEIATSIDGDVLFSYRTFQGHVIEFNTEAHNLIEALEVLASDDRIAAAYPDAILGSANGGIDTLRLGQHGSAYTNAKFDAAWTAVEQFGSQYPHLMNPVHIYVMELGVLNLNDPVHGAVLQSEFGSEPIVVPKTNATTSPHAASVTGIIAATNGNTPPDPSHFGLNFSGIVTSPGQLKYTLYAPNDDNSGNVAKIVEYLEQIDLRKTAIDVVNISWVSDYTEHWGDSSNPVVNAVVHLLGWKSIESRLKAQIERMPSVTFVVAAGNCQRDAAEHYPAKFSLELNNVITVGGANSSYSARWTDLAPSCSKDGNGNSSAFGDAVTVAAPAEDVWTLDINPSNGYGAYGPETGTSYAAPMVSGTVALLKSIDANASPAAIKKTLLNTADAKTICTSPLPISQCPVHNQERWAFLRADKAVDRFINAAISKAAGTSTVNVPARGGFVFLLNRKVYVMNADGSGQRQLTKHMGYDGGPTWSPDGKRIAFDSIRGGTSDISDIYVMNADGSDQRQLTKHSGHNGGPSWSPDGQRIAFHSNRDGTDDIYVMDADGSNQRQLTKHAGFHTHPRWSPDGRHIAFHSYQNRILNIYVMDADGSDQRQLTEHPEFDYLPSWSPDCRRIAFVSDRDGNSNIYVMNADGSDERQVTRHPGWDSHPTWSPDGQRIAFYSFRDGNNGIFIMNADGSDLRQLTDFPEGGFYAPSWSPVDVP